MRSACTSARRGICEREGAMHGGSNVIEGTLAKAFGCLGGTSPASAVLD